MVHGNVEIGKLYCWVIHLRKRKKKKVLKSDIDYWLKTGWIKGGPASRFPGTRKVKE